MIFRQVRLVLGVYNGRVGTAKYHDYRPVTIVGP